MAPPRPGLALVSLIVPSYNEAITFFTTKLNFTLTEDSPSTSSNTGEPKRWVVVHPPNSSDCGILLAQADAQEQKAMIGKQWAGRVGLFLRVEDFKGHYMKVMDGGVEFLGQPREEMYGRVVVFRDPWGNKWDLLGSSLVTEAASKHES